MTSEIPSPAETPGERFRKNVCPVSYSSDVTVMLEIPSVPVHCNLLWPSREAARGAPRGRVELAFSPESGHVWNRAFDPALMEYTQQYENSLHFSPRFQQYAEALAQRLIEQYDIHNKDIVEIGSGKGEFLALLCQMGGNRGFGYDPSYVPDPDIEQAGLDITFVQDMYTERYTDQRADFICCRHVLEHIQFPGDMLLSVRKAIGQRKDTVVFFEVPNVLFTLRDLSIWDIIYEHCSYFSAGSLAYAFSESGFDVLEVREEYNGQFLSIAALPASNPLEWQRSPWDGQDDMLADVAAFGNHYRQKIADWTRRLAQMAQAGQKVVVWGAGSKGVMFLNSLSTSEQIFYVVDINPRKQGMYVAGSGQQIVSPEFLRDYQPDIIVTMNPIYTEEIRQMMQGFGVQAELLQA